MEHECITYGKGHAHNCDISLQQFSERNVLAITHISGGEVLSYLPYYVEIKMLHWLIKQIQDLFGTTMI